MSRMHIQVETPVYEKILPAHCKVSLVDGTATAILWESYIDHRNSKPVYLASLSGRYMVIPEDIVQASTVKSIKKEIICQKA